jgi:hypothetical protein
VVFLKKTTFAGPMNNLGYGIHFTNIAEKAIRMEHGDNLAIFPTSKTINGSKELEKRIVDSYCFNQKGKVIYLYHLSGLHTLSGGYRVGYSVFELDTFTPMEINNINQVDELWVVSKWAKEIVHSYIPDKVIRIIPEGVDTQVFNDQGTFIDYGKKNALNIVNVGKFEKRKGHLVFLEALNYVDRGIDINIIAKWNNHFIRNFDKTIIDILARYNFHYCDNIEKEDAYKAMLFKSLENPRLSLELVTTDHPKPQFLRNIYRSGDLGVYPYFAEGWNLPLIESMACGLPCIASFCTGPTEYLNKKNHISLTKFVKEIAYDGLFFNGKSGTWNAVTVKELVEKLNTNIKNISTLKSISKEAIKTAHEFSWEHSAMKMMEILKNEKPFNE